MDLKMPRYGDRQHEWMKSRRDERVVRRKAA